MNLSLSITHTALIRLLNDTANQTKPTDSANLYTLPYRTNYF